MMDEKTASAIYDILVKVGGAIEGDRQRFISLHTDDSALPTEWRFQGFFGFGGKFYSDSKWRVGYVLEDVAQHPEFAEALAFAANELLSRMWAERNSKHSLRVGKHAQNPDEGPDIDWRLLAVLADVWDGDPDLPEWSPTLGVLCVEGWISKVDGWFCEPDGLALLRKAGKIPT